MSLSRRAFLGLGAGATLAPGAFGQAPGVIVRDARRPKLTHGVQSGDVTHDTAIVWARSDRPARLVVEVAESPTFKGARRVEGPVAIQQNDFTAKLQLDGLPAGRRLHYRARFIDAADAKAVSAPTIGSFKTAPATAADVLVAWSGDTCGQGFGINPELGGMRIYSEIHRLRPDVFVHCGDQIYGDDPLREQVLLDDGSVWRNLVTPAKKNVCESLDAFRGAFRYNLEDANVRAMAGDVAQIVMWDDHEVHNNWWPGRVLDDPRYQERSCDVLAARAFRAMADYTPLGLDPAHPRRLHRSFRFGPRLELFRLDARTYRGPNGPNRELTPGPSTAFLGPQQLAWLQSALAASTATWKVIACDQPLGLVVRHGVAAYEAVANGPGPAMGRELEIAHLLSFLKRKRIRNVVWVTADVHYAADHRYEPKRAVFKDFDPFWEFVSGPLNAGTFGPNALDPTFGPALEWLGIPKDMTPNRPPTDGFQFFGTLQVDGKTGVLTVTHRDLRGRRLSSRALTPRRSG